MSDDRAEMTYPALVVNQWLQEWDNVQFKPELNQSKPDGFFYLLSLPASKLRSLSQTHRREKDLDTPKGGDNKIQRHHDESRSKEIRKYIQFGYPYSSLSEVKISQVDSSTLRKPGWLPSAIVVNILKPGDVRQGKSLQPEDAIQIKESPGKENSFSEILLPDSWTGIGWTPNGTWPIEIIDGQHRLWAFDKEDDSDLNFSLPVVAFHGLDISWQAYLFWTINIKPKKINPSLAFDLYPLLRDQDWLQAGEGLMVYRQARAQELTEALWGTPGNPWYQRINMLGQTGKRNEMPVSQSAFIHSLTSTFVRPWSEVQIGGLFGGYSQGGPEIKWTRVQQAAFLYLVWNLFSNAVAVTEAEWARELRNTEVKSETLESTNFEELDSAFTSRYSLISSDQGVRPILGIFNDFSNLLVDRFRLKEWDYPSESEDFDFITVQNASADLQSNTELVEYLVQLCQEMANFDWRSANDPTLSDLQRDEKAAFRGSGGYSVLKRRLLKFLSECNSEAISRDAKELQSLTK